MPKGFEAQNVWKAKGRGFQMGAIQPDGIVVHLTGQVAWDAEEQVVGIGDVEMQTRKCFENIETLLSEVGGKLSDIVAITTYLTNRDQLPGIQKIRLDFLPAGHEPASTSVVVAGLGHEDFLVEFTPVAVIPRERFRPPE